MSYSTSSGSRTLCTQELLESRRLLSAAANYVAGELLVGFEPGTSQREITRFYAEHAVSERKSLDLQGQGNAQHLRLIAVPAAQTMKLRTELARDPRVSYAEPNYIVQTGAVSPNDTDFARDWGLRNTGQTGGTPDADIDVDEAWDITTGSNNVVVAVIDTGVDYTHPDLAANMWHNPGEIQGNHVDDDGNGFVDDYYGYDFVNEDGDPMDDYFHGTHVAGTIAMRGDNDIGGTGVNWTAQIMAVKIADASGNLTYADAIAGINYVTQARNRGANLRLSNNSWGGTDFSQAMKDAVDAAGQAGLLFVAAAHNQSTDNDAVPLYPASFDSPNIISVAATDQDDRYAAFTNWGATSVDLAAPGVEIWSSVTGGGYGWANGTSMAAPHVAGAAALVWSAFPNLTAGEVKARILNGVDPIGSIGANAAYPTLTNGRLNVRNALVVAGLENDTIAPAAISNLAASAASPWSVKLNWTATGDDGSAGRAGFYDVRYSSTPITSANWENASRATSEPAPRSAGSAETFTVDGLEPGTLYYFAAKVKDNAGNESPLSNVAQTSSTAARFLLNDDGESNTGNWAATGLWHRSNVRGHDSASAWYYGQDSTHTYFNGTQDSGTLTLASPIDLSGVSQALLRFKEWRQVIDFRPLDVARLQVSRNGTDWITVSESFFSTLDWDQRKVDLTPFVGGQLHLRFEFNKNAYDFLPFAITQGHEGWHLDDVQVLVPGTQPTGFSVNDLTIAEGNGGTRQAIFTVTRSSGGGHASVRFATADGSATIATDDYQAASGTLFFGPGETRKTVSVLVNGDRIGESDESFALNLTNPTGAIIADGQGKAAIRDDEPRIHVMAAPVTTEGNEHTTILLVANLSVPSTQTVTVNYATADGTATAPQDYKPTDGTLVFNPGETRKTIAIRLPKDTTTEPIVEAFFVNLSVATSNAMVLRRGVVHILDDDAPRALPHDHERLTAPVLSNLLHVMPGISQRVFGTARYISDTLPRDEGDLVLEQIRQLLV